MKLLLQLANWLDEIAKSCHQRGNRNFTSGSNRIRRAWDPDHNPAPKATA